MANLHAKIIEDGLRFKLSPADARQYKDLVDQLFAKLELSPMPTETRKNPTIDLLMSLATMFGLDEGNDERRYLRVLQEYVQPILNLSDNDGILQEIRWAQSLYGGAFTASGAHRFYPLIDFLQKQNVLPTSNNSEYLEIKAYLSGDHNPATIYQDLPRQTPPLIDFSAVSARLRQNGYLRWLDIGSAFKLEGAPTLKVLKNVFPALEIYGDDISFSLFQPTEKNLFQHSVYVDETQLSEFLLDRAATPFKASGSINGTTYLNGLYPKYNIYTDNFLAAEHYDFISLCFTFHHLHIERNENVTSNRLLSTKTILAENGGELELTDDQKTLLLYPSQTEIFDRLLERLEIGGLFFFNFFPLGDCFYIFQRLETNRYKLYTEHPILFSPDNITYSPSENFYLVKGSPAYKHNGLQKALGLTDSEAKDLRAWFKLADKYNTYYQRWPQESFGRAGVHFYRDIWNPTEPWGPATAARNKIMDWEKYPADTKNLQEFFVDYLIETVPEELKTDLLNAEIIQQILAKFQNP
jgi:hypothetical protein